jgi:ABC-type nitrate/sulfonate/bicarbonate transport system substrate-binding protein
VRPTSLPRRRSAARTAQATLAAGAALALLVGCGGDAESSGSSSAAASADPKAPETTELTGMGFKGGGSASFIQAAKGGAAADYGLTMEMEWLESSAAAIPAVISGDVQVAASSYAGVIDAANQGIPVRVVSGGWASTPNVASLETLPNSGITSLEDLIGKTVAVVSLNSSHAVKIKNSMQEEGLDWKQVNFVELPYGEVPAALEQGTVDASSATGAALTAVKNNLQSVTVFDYGGGEYEGMAETGYIMSQQFIDENPNTVAAFQCAMLRAADEMNSDDAAYREILATDMEFPPPAVEADVKNTFASELNEDELQINADILENIGSLEEPFDMMSIVVPTPTTCD